MLKLFLEINQWHSHSTLFGSYVYDAAVQAKYSPIFHSRYSALLFPAPGTVQKTLFVTEKYVS